MMGVTHRLYGATWAGATLLPLVPLGLPAWQPFTAAALATVTAAGRLSPDMDLKWSGRFAHRKTGGTHDVGWLPYLGAGAAIATALILTAVPLLWWVPLALLTGWTSHLHGDYLFGRASKFRPAGVPNGTGKRGRSGYAGVGTLKAGGLTEVAVRWTILPAALVAEALAVGYLIPT